MKPSITLLTLFLGLNLTIAQNLKPISYKDGEQKLSGLVTSNAGKKLPGVLILPAWKGIDNEAKTQQPNYKNKVTLLLLLTFMAKEISLLTMPQRQKSQEAINRITKLTSKGFR